LTGPARSVSALLIDDDPLTNAAHRTQLEGKGYNVTLVTDSDAALAMIEESRPAVVFVGAIHGHGKSSADFLQSLRTSRSSQHTPVVILSTRPSTRPPSGLLQTVRRERW
jgi:DNA-binding response OmpR family regulator